jgi:tetratricopeptide (TPR) repeat protein
MSKSRRTTAPQSAPARGVPSDATPSDPLSGLLRTLVVGLVVVRWLIPTESAGAGDTLWLVLLGFAAVILWAWGCLRTGTYAVRWSLFDCALWSLVAAHLLSAAFVFATGGDRRTALNMAWEWVGLGATFFLLRQTIHTALAARRFAAIVVSLAVVLSGWGIWQHYVYYKQASREYLELIEQLDALEKNPQANARELGKLQLKIESQGIPTDEMGRRQYVNRLQFSNEALGPFALANTFAGFLLVALVLAGELFRTLDGPRSKALLAAWAAALVLLLYCLILTKSRTAWTGLVVAGALWGTTILVRNRRRVTRRIWLSLGLGTVGVLILFAIAAVGKGFDAEVISEAPKSLSYRFQYWHGAARTVAASPIFGTGPGNFRHHYLRYKVAESSEEIADPHNWLLDLWTSGGILAVVSFLACVVLAILPFRRRQTDDDPQLPQEARRIASWTADLPGAVLGFLFGFVAPVASASGNFDLMQWPLLAAWLIAFAILRRGLGSARLARIALGAAAVGLMIHLSGAGGIEMPAAVQILLVLVALAFATLERPAEGTGSPRLVIAIAGVGVLLFVALFLTGILPVLNRRAALVSGEQALFVDGQFERAKDDFAAAALFDPLSPEPLDKLADAFFARWQSAPQGDTLGDFAKACQSLEQAIGQDPLNPTRYRRLGEFYLARFGRSRDPADAKTAAEEFQRAIAMYPTDASLRSAYSTALADAGNLAAAKSEAQSALEQDEINHHWGHTDRYLPDPTLARLRSLAADRNP